MLKLTTLLFTLGFFNSFIYASDFKDLWEEISRVSKSQKANTLEKESLDLEKNRLNRHWLPRVYLKSNWFRTDDPGQVFFNHLGQRSIKQEDFVPNDLNSPGEKSFNMTTLGINLPLFEGGMKSSQGNMIKHIIKANEADLKARKTEDFTKFSTEYGNFLISQDAKRNLLDLNEKLKNILSKYEVGRESNPVGHSGLLGLKSVKNRLVGVLNHFNLLEKNALTYFNEKRESTENLKLNDRRSLKEFVNEELNAKTTTSTLSSKLLTESLKVESLEELPKLERSRFLPQIGLFFENMTYSGSRDTENSKAIGLYLIWDIFNNDSYGRISEANAKLAAARAKIEQYKQEEKIASYKLAESKETLENNLELLSDSSKILADQTSNMMKLFNSSMINALQLAEVLNRRIDLVMEKTTLEKNYLETMTNIYQLNN